MFSVREDPFILDVYRECPRRDLNPRLSLIEKDITDLEVDPKDYET